MRTTRGEVEVARVLQKHFKCLALAIVTMAPIAAVGWAPFSAALAQAPSVSFSIRLAETVPTKGYKKVKVRGRDTTIYIAQEDALTQNDVEIASLEDFKEFIGLRLVFTKAGKEKLASISSAHLSKPLAVLLNGEVVSAPVVRMKLLTGKGGVLIQGSFSRQEIEALVGSIKAGRQLRSELARIEGTWVAISGRLNGEDKPPPKGVEIEFMNGKFRMATNGTVTDEGTFRIDPSKTPKAIDLTHSIGRQKGKTGLGLYELRADGLSLCMAAADGSARPTNFSSPAGKNHFLMVWKKKPAEKKK